MIFYFENWKTDEDGNQIDISTTLGEELYLWHESNGRLMAKDEKGSSPAFVVLSLASLKKMNSEKLGLKKDWQADFAATVEKFKKKWAEAALKSEAKKTKALLEKVTGSPQSPNKSTSTSKRI